MFVLLTALFGAVLLIMNQDKTIHKLKDKPDTLRVVEYVELPADTIIRQVPVIKRVPERTVVTRVRTDTVYVERDSVEVAELDTTIENVARLHVKYYLPPLSTFYISLTPFSRLETTKITKPIPPRKFSFSTTLLAGMQKDDPSHYRVGLVGSLFFKDIGLSGFIGSDGVWMLGLAKRW